MNTASPFQPAAEEGFTIRELSILLPPQLLKSEGLPPDYLVPLPLDSLRATFLQGRPCLRLSQIFQSCPYLFNRQLMPGEDQEVALPYQKVRRILEGAGGQPMPQAAPAQPPNRSQSPMDPSGSPFAIQERAQNSPFMVANSQEAAVLKPMDSPFQMAPGQSIPQPPPAQSAQSPFQMAAPAQQPFPGAQMPPANASPFSVQPNQASNSPFQMAQPGQGAAPSPAVNSPFGPPGPIPGQQQPAPMQAPVQGNSPFQLASAVPPAPAPVQQNAPQPVPQSPFTVSDRLPGTERPPAIPAPGAASPFQTAPQGGAPRPAAPAMEAPASPFKPMSEPPAQQFPQAPPAPQAPQGQLPAMAPSGQPFALPPMQAPPMQDPPQAVHPLPERTFSPPILIRTEQPVSGSPLPPILQPPARPVELPRQEIAPLPPIPPPAAPPALAPIPPSAGVSNEPEEVTLRLNSVLRNASVADLGFDPANVPEAVTVQLPISLIKSQLATGKVLVQISDIVQGVAAKFRPAFARARGEMEVSLPLSDLFHALPSGLIPSAPPAPAAQSEPAKPAFVTPFQHVAAEDADRVAKPAAPVLPPLISPQAQDAIEGGPQSFLAGHDDLGTPRSAETLTEAPPQHLPLRGAPAAPFAPPAPLAEMSLPELTKPVGYLPPLPAMAAPAEPPAFTPPPQIPAPLPPIQREPQAAAPVAQPAPQASSVPEPQDLQFGYQERPELLALRYLLDSPSALSPAQVTQKMAELPGIAAAVLLSPNGQHTGNSSNQETDVFFAKASKSHDSLKALADSIGMPPQGNFTLRADQMVRTFVLEGSICVAVLHREANLAPQVRDKLILITRELAKLHA